MNKAEMVDRLAARTGLNKAAARDAVDSMFAVIDEDLACCSAQRLDADRHCSLLRWRNSKGSQLYA